MNSSEVRDKIKVFISSNCDKDEEKEEGRFKYGIVRKALKWVLDNTGMCETYAFEKAGASTANVSDSYMDALKDSDLVVIIVDNKDGVSNGTQEEINYVLAQEKKTLFFFCNDVEKKVTELQKELKTKGIRYEEACAFTEIIEQVRNNVLQDIVNRYKAFCRGRLNRVDPVNDQVLDVEPSTIEERASISKESFKGFAYTKYLLRREAGFCFETLDVNNDDEHNCAALFARIIGATNLESVDYEVIKEFVVKAFSGKSKIRELIKKRYEAIEAYFAGCLEECEKKLHMCLDYCENEWKTMPKWIKDDVTIDLRYVETEIEISTGKRKNDASQMIYNAKEPLNYPLIDRIVSEYSENVIRQNNSNRLMAQYAVDQGSIELMLNRICDIFIVAYYYGSITQMIYVRKRVSDCLMQTAIETRNTKTFLFCVRLLSLDNRSDLLRAFVQAYGVNSNAIRSEDVHILVNCAKSRELEFRSVGARLLLLCHFGYYYDDTIYEVELNEIKEIIKQFVMFDCFRELNKDFVQAIKANKNRISRDYVVNYLELVHSCGKKEDIYKLLAVMSQIGIGEMNESTQVVYQRILKDLLGHDASSAVLLAAQSLRKEETIAHESLDEAVRHADKVFFEEEYRVNTFQLNETEMNERLQKWIDTIQNCSKLRENGIIIRIHVELEALRNVVLYKNELITEDVRTRLVEVLCGLLSSKDQYLSDKAVACEILCALIVIDALDGSVVDSIKALDNKQVLLGEKYLYGDFRKSFSITALSVLYQVLMGGIKAVDENELEASCILVQNEDVTSLFDVLRLLEEIIRLGYFSVCSNEVKKCLFRVMLNSSYHEVPSIRMISLRSLVLLSKDDGLRRRSLERVSCAMSEEPYDIKVEVLRELSKVEYSDDVIAYIREKTQNDTNYAVRRASEKVKVG